MMTPEHQIADAIFDTDEHAEPEQIRTRIFSLGLVLNIEDPAEFARVVVNRYENLQYQAAYEARETQQEYERMLKEGYDT